VGNGLDEKKEQKNGCVAAEGARWRWVVGRLPPGGARKAKNREGWGYGGGLNGSCVEPSAAELLDSTHEAISEPSQAKKW